MGRRTNPKTQRIKGITAVTALRLIACLPFALNRWAATLLGRLIAAFPTDARRVSEVNLSLCYPDRSEPERRKLARESLVESIKNTFEIALFWRHPDQGLKRVAAVDGDAPLRQAVVDGKPIMILAPHLGCWE
ncbi:lysophospholipid acyltransferase family protein, partial [Alcanivorax sp. HI0083]